MILIIQLSFGDVHNLKSWELYILSQEKKKIYSKGRWRKKIKHIEWENFGGNKKVCKRPPNKAKKQANKKSPPNKTKKPPPQHQTKKGGENILI